VNHYLKNYRYGNRLFETACSLRTQLIVVIPCHNEPNLIRSLEALKCCEKPKGDVEVIVVINAGVNDSESIKEQNRVTFQLATQWASNNSIEQFMVLVHMDNDLPKKHAGVGLARKIGMDEAVDRFEQISNENGVIVCFDADAMCDSNYLVEIETEFANHPKWNGASIHFEHPLRGNEVSQELYGAIAQYELFLRYYRLAFKYTGHPQAYHTVGSSMAVRSNAYQKQTGMNKRKAGEDFYFLQKIIQLGHFGEITNTKVIPSPRTSERVPFGTGRAMAEFLDGRDLGVAYDFKSFSEIKTFINLVFSTYRTTQDFGTEFLNQLPEPVKDFLLQSDWDTRVEDLLQYGKTESTFSNRFYNWFNAFRMLKWVHFARDNFYANIELKEACTALLNAHYWQKETPETTQAMLELFRELDEKRK
jgi:glycosyltransferase involved in cell wall biosynthesis